MDQDTLDLLYILWYRKCNTYQWHYWLEFHVMWIETAYCWCKSTKEWAQFRWWGYSVLPIITYYNNYYNLYLKLCCYSYSIYILWQPHWEHCCLWRLSCPVAQHEFLVCKRAIFQCTIARSGGGVLSSWWSNDYLESSYLSEEFYLLLVNFAARSLLL